MHWIPETLFRLSKAMSLKKKKTSNSIWRQTLFWIKIARQKARIGVNSHLCHWRSLITVFLKGSLWKAVVNDVDGKKEWWSSKIQDSKKWYRQEKQKECREPQGGQHQLQQFFNPMISDVQHEQMETHDYRWKAWKLLPYMLPDEPHVLIKGTWKGSFRFNIQKNSSWW